MRPSSYTPNKCSHVPLASSLVSWAFGAQTLIEPSLTLGGPLDSGQVDIVPEIIGPGEILACLMSFSTAAMKIPVAWWGAVFMGMGICV